MAKQPIHILLIESNHHDAELIQEMLADIQATGLMSSEFRLVHADRLSTGLNYLAAERFDIILLDLWLPDSQGLETLIKVQAEFSSIPILILAVHEDKTLALDVLRHGAQDYLLKKHLNSNMLSRVWLYTIERHRLTAELARYTQDLQASEARKSAILEAALDCIITIDHEGRIIEANPATERTFGYDSVNIQGKLLTELIDLVSLSQLSPGELNAVNGTVLGRRIETVAKRVDGSEFFVELTMAPIPLEGSPMYTAYLRDITQRKQAEQAEKELMQMKDEFIASVSHELRTPLYSIKGFVDLLRQGKVKEPKVRQEFLDRVAQDVKRLTTLVNDLLDLSRLEAGQLDLKLEEVDLNLLIDETLRSMQGLAAQKEMIITHAPLEDSVMVKVDHHRLQQVLVNLVGNAIKFSEARRPIQIVSQIEQDSLMIKVIDQGPGIPSEALPRLFSKFYQADNSVKRVGKGTGLGLYISKKIIEAHGGQISVKSKLGHGTVFFFTLPLPVKERNLSNV